MNAQWDSDIARGDDPYALHFIVMTQPKRIACRVETTWNEIASVIASKMLRHPSVDEIKDDLWNGFRSRAISTLLNAGKDIPPETEGDASDESIEEMRLQFTAMGYITISRDSFFDSLDDERWHSTPSGLTYFARQAAIKRTKPVRPQQDGEAAAARS